MVFTFGKFIVDIDIEKNRTFYQTAEALTVGCNCNGCANFEKAADLFPELVREFFRGLGVDPKKPAEVYVNCSEDGGKRLFYGGFYHLCGTVLDDKNAWISQEVDGITIVSCINEDYLYEIADGYCVIFGDGGDALLEDGFPEPVITMDIEFHVPWVLDEENTYK
ncbi:MAG: hypothetical protein K2N06_06390 [Oscillospiraceae bacterium]|nr:hypothetical protein [Oscillospiraceae bacterium]